MTGREVPRSVQALIVRDLARNHRTADAIARRHHVPRELVDALKQRHGPDPESLIRAAAELDRPVSTPRSAAPKPVGNSDGLTVDERAACYTWALATGRSSGTAGPLARALVAEWDDLGRPTGAAGTPAIPEAAPDAPEAPTEPTAPESDTETDNPDTVTALLNDWVLVDDEDRPELEPIAAQEQQPDDDVIDAEIVPFWSDWDLLFARADAVLPPLTTAWIDVEEAVERLRDALRDHDHREQLLHRVQGAIKPHLHLTLDQVRLVLDAIEAGA